jgi:hypothetical protein
MQPATSEVAIKRPVTSTNMKIIIQAAVTRDGGGQRLTSHLQRSNVMPPVIFRSSAAC